MGQELINLFVNASIYNETSCIHDSRLGYHIAWRNNNDLNGFDSYSGVTSVTAWDGVYFAVSNSSSCYIGPSGSMSFDGSLYSLIKLGLRIDPGHHVELPTTGKIQFQTSSEETWDDNKSVEFDITADNAYHEYLIDMSAHQKWIGTVSKLRIYPFTDGSAGLKIHIRYLKIEGRSTYGCASQLTGSVCDKAYAYSHPCPWTGSAGLSVSSAIDGGVTIVEDVNDKLLINIDGYGEQGVTLRPVTGAKLQDVARDLQDKLNLVGVGGYAFARCYVVNKKLYIESDWFDADSSVVVTEPTEQSAGATLGFFDSSGNKIATETSGTDSASRYERAPVQLNSSAVRRLKNSDTHITEQGAFSMDGTAYSPQGGNSNYRQTIRDRKLTFKNKTLIDYDNPITSNGIITNVGYSGDAYKNTEFRIYRQRVDGWLDLVGTVDMSVSVDDTDKIFEATTSIKVKKGDLLSLYSAALHLGSNFEKENYSYILVDYQLAEGGRMWDLSGSGNKGLPLFARGDRRTDEAILVVDFDEVQSVESVYVTAEEDDVLEEINLCTLRNGGLNGGPYVSGSTGTGDNGAPALDMENLDALIDGEKQNINGVSSYCYPGWLDLTPSVQADYEYSSFQVTFDFAKGIDVYFPVYKIVHYFVDEQNVKTFKWEIPTATNPSDTERIWGVGWDSYEYVYTDLGIMDASTIYLYNNPAVVISTEYQVSYAHLKYRYLEFILDEPFSTRSMRYNVTLEDTNTTDVEQDDYSYFPPAPSPKIQEIEVFAKSVPDNYISENFYFESSKDGDEFLVHYDTDIVSSTRAKYTIGRPIKSLKVHIESTNTMKVFDIRGILSEDPVSYETNYRGTVALNPPKNNPDIAVETVTITNDGAETSNFYIDIFDAGTHNERCLLWNRMVHDDGVSQSELGPGGIVNRRGYRALRPYNYAYNCPGYFLDKTFFFGAPVYVSRDDRASWLSVGSVITDGSDSTYVTNESASFHQYYYVYVAVDLGDHYAIDSVELFSGGGTGFSSMVLYSKLDTDDPSNIPTGVGDPDGWLTSSRTNARWILLQAPAVNLGGPNIRYLTRIEVNVDYSARLNNDKNIWKSASGNLTNGIAGGTELGQEEGWIYNDQSDYFCVDLGWWHNVTDVITGPMGVAANSMDIDAVEPGTWPSIVNSAGAGSTVAYSKTSTDNPAEVTWGDFGDEPDNPVRWVMVKTDNYRVEEIIVHTDDNEPNDKPSFLNKVWFSSASASVYNEYAHTKSGICAIALDYPENAQQQEEYILFNQSLGVDTEMARRDALAFWLYVSDVSQLDFTYGYFRLGKAADETNTPKNINLTMDEYNYYEWPLSSFEGYLEDGWNYIRMPFTDNYKNGRIFFAADDLSRVGSTYRRDRIKYFKFAFRGVSSNEAFTVRMDDFTVNRRYYSEGMYDYGVYVPYGEYIKFPLNDFDPMKGTIEFFLKADWTKEITCNTCQDPRDHSIFRVFSSEDETMFSLFMSGKGLKFYATDGKNPTIVTDNTFSVIPVDVPTHIATVWDFTGEYDAPSMGIYINGQFAVGLDYEVLEAYGIARPSFIQRAFYTMMIGGQAWTGLVSYDSSSVDGAVENIKLFNYPITDFSYVMNNQTFPTSPRSSDLILVSLDGSTYYGAEDKGTSLPLFKQNVASGESFTLYVKSRNLDKTKVGEKNRLAHIAVARTPA